MKSRIIVNFIFLTVVTPLMLYPVVTKGQAVEDGLIGYWTFDEKDTDINAAKDQIGNKHPGEIKGKPKIVEGKVNEALRFNGKEDYVVMGEITEGQDLTYAMWVKVEKLPDGPKVIIWDDNPNGGGDAWLQLNANGTVETQRGGDGFGVFSSKSSVKAGEWTHITYVADGKNDIKTLYLNGEPDGDQGGKITTRTGISHVVVAVGHDRNSFIKPWYFEGDIDEVAIYLRALTPQEVKENYNVDSGDTNVDFIGKLAMTWGRIKNK